MEKIKIKKCPLHFTFTFILYYTPYLYPHKMLWSLFTWNNHYGMISKQHSRSVASYLGTQAAKVSKTKVRFSCASQLQRLLFPSTQLYIIARRTELVLYSIFNKNWFAIKRAAVCREFERNIFLKEMLSDISASFDPSQRGSICLIWHLMDRYHCKCLVT